MSKEAIDANKAQFELNRGKIGSRFIKFWPSEISSPKHRKGYRPKQGRFETRILQSLSGWKEALKHGAQWRKQMRKQGM